MSRARNRMVAGRASTRCECGFTLIELMISMAMFALVSLAGFTVLSSGQKSSVMNDEVVKIQQNVRLAVDLVANDIRMAGYGNPASPSSVPLVANGCTSIVNPTNSSTGPDSIAVVTMDRVIGRLQQNAPLAPATSTSTITLDSVTGLASNDIVSLDGLFTATVSGINTGSKVLTLGTTIQTPITFNGDATGTGTQVVRLACVKYSVDTTNNQLLRDGVAVVDGIEDLQLAYGVDADGDGKIDDLSGNGSIDCLDLTPNSLATATTNSVGCSGAGSITTPPAAATPTTIRLIRISVVGKAGKNDPTYTTSSAVSVEDHNIASTAGYRRRVLTRTVSLRDLGL